MDLGWLDYGGLNMEFQSEAICINSMKQMTDQQLAWIVKYGTDMLHDRLYYLKKKMEATE